LRGSFGFIALETGESLFFHRTGCAEGNRFSGLQQGDRVRCKLCVDATRRRRGEAVELYSGE
jgi:cold shock CspA family protein